MDKNVITRIETQKKYVCRFCFLFYYSGPRLALPLLGAFNTYI